MTLHKRWSHGVANWQPLERRLRIELEVYRRAAQFWRTVAPTPEQIHELCGVLAEVFYDAQEELPTVRLLVR